MNNKELFKQCIKEAIEIGREYMLYPPENQDEPTEQEWNLALILFQKKITPIKIVVETTRGVNPEIIT